MPAPSPPASKVAPPPAERLSSLDALRGFAMMWIVGADALGGAFARLNGGSWSAFAATQLEHSAWEGFRFYDLIFPLFVFMVGVALTYSLGGLVATKGRHGALRRVFRRAIIMYLLGILYYGGFATPISQFRLMGVLQRLAFCYFFASLLMIYLRPRALFGALLALLVGYWAAMTFVPVPGFGPGDFGEGHNLANWVDAHYLPLRKHDGDHDVEGLLSTLPAIGTCLLGVFAGLLLRDPARSPRRRALLMAGAGVALIAGGYAWGLQFPVIKKLWTSSFVLVAGGWSAVLLAGFYFLIDVAKVNFWAQPLVWIGTNALTIYLLSRFVDFRALSAHVAGGDVERGLNACWAGLGGLVLALTSIVICTGICRFLYLRKIFLRL